MVAHPCDETSLRGAVEVAEVAIIVPTLVGPEGKIRAVAEKEGSHRVDPNLLVSGQEQAAARARA